MARFSKKKKILLKKKPEVDPQLKDFDIKVNPFGEIQSNYDIDAINKFLNKNMKDKKIKRRPGKDDSK